MEPTILQPLWLWTWTFIKWLLSLSFFLHLFFTFTKEIHLTFLIYCFTTNYELNFTTQTQTQRINLRLVNSVQLAKYPQVFNLVRHRENHLSLEVGGMWLLIRLNLSLSLTPTQNMCNSGLNSTIPLNGARGGIVLLRREAY